MIGKRQFTMCRIFSNHKGQTARSRNEMKKNPYSVCSPRCSLLCIHTEDRSWTVLDRLEYIPPEMQERERKRPSMQSSNNNNHHWIPVFFLPYPISNNHNIGHGTQHFMYHSLCTHVRIYAHKCGSISTGERDHTRQEHRMKHTKKHHQIAVISNIQKKPFKCISKFYPIGELYACARIFTQRRHRVVFSCDWHFCMPFARHCKLNRRHLLALMMLKTNFANKTRERDYLQIWIESIT